MKIISNSDFVLFNELKKKKMVVDDTECVRDYYIEVVKNKEDEIGTLRKDIENQQISYEILSSQKDEEIKVKILRATEESRKKIETLTIENGSLKKENEVLNKAFENLGFDVKDMKEMMGKLVDGIISKNTVQLIK